MEELGSFLQHDVVCGSLGRRAGGARAAILADGRAKLVFDGREAAVCDGAGPESR